MKLALVSLHYKRPALSRQCLDAITAAKPSWHWPVGLFVEPGCEETSAICDAWADANTDDVFAERYNITRLGVNQNTFQAFAWAFDEMGADFCADIEDDCIAAPDALAYLRWAAETYRDDPSILSVTAYNRADAMPAESEWHTVKRRPWMHGWIWGTWADRWRAALPHLQDPKWTWDVQFNEYRRRRGLSEIYPVLSRSQNLGRESTVYPNPPPPEWYDANHRVRFFAGDVDVPSAPWRFVA